MTIPPQQDKLSDRDVEGAARLSVDAPRRPEHAQQIAGNPAPVRRRGTVEPRDLGRAAKQPHPQPPPRPRAQAASGLAARAGARLRGEAVPAARGRLG